MRFRSVESFFCFFGCSHYYNTMSQRKSEKITVVTITVNSKTQKHIIDVAPCEDCQGSHILHSTAPQKDICANENCAKKVGGQCGIGGSLGLVCKYCHQLFCSECAPLDELQKVCDYCNEYIGIHFEEWKDSTYGQAKATFTDYESYLQGTICKDD